MSRGKIFFWSGMAFLGGVALASFWVPPPPVFFSLLIAGFLSAVFWPRRLVFGLLLLGVGLGLMRFSLAHQPDSDQIGNWNGTTAELRGVITAEPEEQNERTKLIIAVAEVAGEKATGNVLVSVPRYPAYDYGQALIVRGRLEAPENFADFDYQNYLARSGIYSTMYEPQIEVVGKGGNLFLAALLSGKKALVCSLQRSLPEPAAGFSLGILLGQKSAVGEDTQTAFRDSGTMHVMAVSGYNITVVVSLLISATRWAGRRGSFLIAIAGIIVFVLLTGASASVVRAALMGGLVLLAQQSGRVSNVRNILLAAAVIMVAANPLVLRFDIGFQLSFMAVLGLVYVGPRLEKFLIVFPAAFLLRSSLTATLAANALTLPVSLLYFGQISPWSPLINAILLPSIPIAMGLSFLVALAGFLGGALPDLLAYPAWLILTYGIEVVKWGAVLPGAVLRVEGWLRWVVLSGYLAIGLVAKIWLSARGKKCFPKKNPRSAIRPRAEQLAGRGG